MQLYSNCCWTLVGRLPLNLSCDSFGGYAFDSRNSLVEWWNDRYAFQKCEIIGTRTSKINCENAVVTD